MHFTRLSRLIVALLAVFAFAGVAAAAAQAEEAPFWSIKGTRLAAGQTHYISAKLFPTTAFPAFTLKTILGETVQCRALKLKEGVILGSNAGNPGTNDEAVEFTKCTVTNNGTNCSVVEPLVTNSLKSELVENVETEGGKERPGKKLYIEFFPNVGKVLATINFTGTACNVTSTKVEGSVAGEVLTDPGEVPVELPNEKKEAISWLVRFPEKAITKVWLIREGVGAAANIELRSFGLVSTLSGIALTLLANSKGESVEEEWSPLP